MQTVRPIMPPFLFLSSCDSSFLLNRMMLNLFLVSFKNIRMSCCCCFVFVVAVVVVVVVVIVIAAGTVVIIVTVGYNALSMTVIPHIVTFIVTPLSGSSSWRKINTLKPLKMVGTTHPATECHSIVRITHLMSLLLLLLWDFIWTSHIAWFEIYGYKNYCFKKSGCLHPQIK